MDAFAAESAAWRIKAAGDNISSDALAMAKDVKRGDEADLRRRLLAIRKLFADGEKKAAEFLNALEPEFVS